MKTALITATFLAFAAGSAFAAPAARTDARQLYTCAGTGLSRVALAPTPHSCCDGLLGCPQLLSNTGLVKPRRDSRT